MIAIIVDRTTGEFLTLAEFRVIAGGMLETTTGFDVDAFFDRFLQFEIVYPWRAERFAGNPIVRVKFSDDYVETDCYSVFLAKTVPPVSYQIVDPRELVPNLADGMFEALEAAALAVETLEKRVSELWKNAHEIDPIIGRHGVRLNELDEKVRELRENDEHLKPILVFQGVQIDELDKRLAKLEEAFI